MRDSNTPAVTRATAAAACVLLIAGLLTFARPVPVGAAVAVTMRNIAFVPATLTISVGTTVTWTNRDTEPHTTTSDLPLWGSALLANGASFSFTFTKAGTFAYHCNVHPSMHGTITVLSPASPTATRQRPTATALPPTATPRPPTATAARAIATATPHPPATPTIRATLAATTAARTPVPAAPYTPTAAPAPVTNPAPIQPGPVSALGFANFAEPIRPFADSPDHRFFMATHHTLNFGFKAFWEQNGGLALFGYPISEEFLERGADGVVRTVQYFERARFEYHNDLAPPYQVEMGMLGREMTAGRLNEPPFLPVSPDTAPGALFFAPTGHTLSGQFAAFWQANGGLALFGYPISEPFTETGADGIARTVQYFERYQFGYHVESGTVELGRLGVRVAQAYGYLPA